jgi:hypothetical protein
MTSTASPSQIVKCKGCGCPLHVSTTTGVCSDYCAADVEAADRVATAAAALAAEAVEMGAETIADMAEQIDENEAVDAALASVGVTLDTVPCSVFMEMVGHVIAAADVALAEGPR